MVSSVGLDETDREQSVRLMQLSGVGCSTMLQEPLWSCPIFARMSVGGGLTKSKLEVSWTSTGVPSQTELLFPGLAFR